MILFFCLTRLGKPGNFYAMGISNAIKTKVMYINFESVEIETIDGKKSKQTVVEETGEQAANTLATGHVLRKET